MGSQDIILLLGAPGAGKGTQARKLAREFKLNHISTGDALREETDRGTELGRQVGEVMARGELVDDHLVGQIIRDRIAAPESREGVILDGFPRSLDQARLLEEYCGGRSTWIVDLQVDRETLIKRLSGRRYCTNCGKIYNFYFSPPQEQGVCDRCGEPLVHRSDDREEVVQKRLEVYEDVTKPLVEFYSGRGQNYQQVDGNQDPEKVFGDISSKLKKVGVRPFAHDC